MRRFSEVYTDGNVFFIKNLYKKEQRVDAVLFDKIVEVRSLFKSYHRLYYTIYFKNGMTFHFMKEMETLFGPPIDYDEDLGKQLTKEVKDFLSVNP